MRRAIACFTLFASSAYAVNTGEVTLRGYTSEHAAAEVQWEQKFRELPDPAKVRENMRRMSARPHHVGSPYDKDNGSIPDGRRTSFFREELAELARAIADGARVRAFHAWSLLDNFEWADGYSQRYGLNYVDFRDQKRTTKASGQWYGRVSSTGHLDL